MSGFVDKKSYDMLWDDREQRIQYAESLKQALAEKDLFLAQANRHKEELFAKLAEKDKAYQQLMEQAIEWAKEWQNPTGYPSQISAYRFLQSDEVKAFLKEREGT